MEKLKAKSESAIDQGFWHKIKVCTSGHVTKLSVRAKGGGGSLAGIMLENGETQGGNITNFSTYFTAE